MDTNVSAMRFSANFRKFNYILSADRHRLRNLRMVQTLALKRMRMQTRAIQTTKMDKTIRTAVDDLFQSLIYFYLN